MTRIALPAAPLLAALVLLGLLMPLDVRAQATVPGTPAVDEVTARAGWLLVKWSAPSTDGGSTVTAYDVRHIETSATDKADSQWTEKESIWTAGDGDLRYALDGLTNGTGYDVQVRAVNAEGDGPWSATVTGTPEISEATRATLTMVRGDDGALAVAWKAPTTLVDPDATYDLRYIETDATDKSDGEWTETTGASTDDLLLYGLTGLTNDTEYDVQVRAVEFATAGPWSNTMSATPADYGQKLNDAREITLATTSSGEIDPVGSNYFWGKITDGAVGDGVIHSSDWDYFKMVITDDHAPKPLDFQIFTEGSMDTSGTLFNAVGESIIQVGNGPGLPNPDNFLIRYTLQAGTYYIRVLADSGVTGEYVLRIKAAPETTGPADPKKLILGGSTSGLISPVGDTDSFNLELTERTDVIIRGFGRPDVTARLLNEHGAVLAQNNDGNLAPKPEGFLIRRTLDAGTYELEVSSHRGLTSGGYTVYTSDAGNPGNTAATAQAITLDNAVGGNITSTSDVDYFSITVEDTTYVQIWAAPNDSRTDVDAEIVDAGGTPIDADFNENFAGAYARIFSFGIAHELDAGTHYMKVTGAGNSTGRYTVIILDDWGFARMVDTCKDVARGGISDTWYGCQWHLQDDGLSGSGSTEDINVEGVWSGGNRGAGITVAVVDQGMHHQHEDLTDNVDTSRNHDFVGQGGVYHPFETHGTAVAGIIAARDNSIGTRGVAPRATIYGYNLLSTGHLNDEFDAMSLNAATTAVSNNSWGQGDTGSPEYAPSMWAEVIENAVNTGYGGKGVFYVWSAGNGARNGDYSTLDERNNFHAVTAACAVNQEGKRTYYSEKGANLWVCAPSNDSGTAGIATTTNSNRYTNAFGGTSAAAPIVSGVAALVRKANNALTWRDVKLILAASARKNDASNSGWETGASKYGDTGTYNFNHEYGFGVVDAQAAVSLANGWTNVPGLRRSTVEAGTINVTIPDATSTNPGATVTSKLTVGSHVEFVEYVHVDAHFDHDSFRHLDVELESPDGKVSKLAPYFDQTAFGSDIPFAFMDNPLRLGSAKHLGESAEGEWTLRVTDHIHGKQGTLESWDITVFGHGTKPTAPGIDEVQPISGGFRAIWKTPADPGASDITGYDVHYIRSDAADKADGQWATASVASSAREYTATGLDGGVRYDVRVRAVNSDGNGPWSRTSKVTADSADAPTITSVTSVEQTLITKWTPPANSGLGTVASYDLRHKFTNFGGWTTVDGIWATGDGNLEYTHTPSSFLGYGRSHYVQMRAVVGSTEHPWSASRTVVTVPSEPTITTITADPGGSKINVPWAHAVSTSQFPVTSYDLRYIETSKDEAVDANWTVKTGVWTSREGYTIDGLTNWVQYDVQVRGWNAGGPGPWSATKTGTPTNSAVRVTLQWEKTSVDVNEDAGSVTLKATATTDVDAALPSDFSFDATVTTEDGTATESEDYVAPSNGTLTFQQSDFERVSTGSGYRYRATREFSVTILSDDADEADETFTATLDYVGTATTNLLGGNSVATVTINDVNNNRAPEFEDDTSATRSIDENSTQGTAVGAPVAATDLNGDTLTYSIDSQQGGPYTVDDTTGQIRVGAGATLDYERRTTQRVNLRVEDPNGLSDTIQVRIEIADVNEPPVVNGNATVDWQENRTGNITRYTATDPERDSVEWSVKGADANFFTTDSGGYLTFNDPPDFEDKADDDSNGLYQITVVATDTAGNFDELYVTITVTNVNEPPTVDGRTALALSENDDAFDERYTATDPEGGSTTFAWSVSGADGGDFQITRDNQDGVLTFRNTPDYERPADSNGNNEYLVQVRASDGQYTGTLNVTVTVANVNEPPEFNSSSLSRTSFSYAENGTAALYTYRATDPERDTISWSVSGTDRNDFDISSAGVLTFAEIPDFEMPDDANGDNEYLVTVVAEDDNSNRATLDVVVTVTNSTGAEEPTITTTGNPSPYRENGTGAVYTFRARDPQGRAVAWSITGTDRHAFEISASGVLTFASPPDFENPTDSGRDNSYEITVVVTDDQGLIDSVDVIITVTNHNEGVEPTIGSRSPPSTYPENRTSTVYTFSASDPQRQTLAWRLEGDDSGAFTLAIDSGGRGVLGFATPPDFEDPVDRDRQNDYNLIVVATDPDGHADRLSFTITVTDVNEGPEVTGGGDTFAVQENRNWPGATFTASDPEGGSVTRWSLGGRDAGDFTISNTGQITFRNTPDHERPDDADRDNVYEVEVRPYDGRYYGSHAITLTVEDTTEITGPSTLSRDENFTGTLSTYAATGRGDLSVNPNWRLAGTDSGDFTISAQGEVSFRNTPDHERPADSNQDNVYTFAVQVTDGRYYDSYDVTVTVTPVNEPPTITTTSSSATALRQNENLTSRLYTYRATDPEGSATITWSVSGVDGRFFAITQRGEFSFREDRAPDFEIPGDSGRDNVYDVLIQAEDDGGNRASLTVAVTVRDVNEGPEVTRGRSSFTVQENRDLPNAVYSGFDPEGGTITRWTVGGTDGGDFTITHDTVTNEGVLTFRNLPDYERPADSNGDNVYQLQVRPYDGRYYGSFEVTVTVTPVNEPPIITTNSRSATTMTHPENRTSRLYTYRATDPERAAIAWAVGGADGRHFAIDERGQFSFNPVSPPDFEARAASGQDHIYAVTVRASDGTHTASLPVTVTVTDVNEGPEVTSGRSSFTISENQGLTGSAYTAIDPEGAYVTRWSVGGRDGGDFFITQGGTLYFRKLPDYERPADSNQDNVYEVLIQPYDGRNTGSFAVTITVTDVNEPPEFRSGSRTSFTQPENRAARLYTFSAADPERGEVGWSVGGTDGRFFTIDERGQFSFDPNSPPDHDSPADSGADNTYDVSIEASDPEGHTARLAVIVRVTDANEGPVITRQGGISGSPPGTVPENHPTTDALATYTAADPERPGVRITGWSTSGRDGGDFVMNALGELRFRNSPDYERPADSNGDNVYEVVIRASDGRYTGTLEEVQVVTVVDVNEPPVITTTGRTTFTQPENRNTVLYTYRATDPERGTVSWRPDGTDGHAFTIDEQGRFSFTNPPDFESPTDSGRDNVYNVTVEARDDEFNAARLEITVTVTNHNEGVQPTISTRRPPATYQENRTTTVYTFRASDPQRGVITWSLTGPDANDFSISETGALTFNHAPDFENSVDADRNNAYELTVVATDEEGYTDRMSFTITVTNHNEGVEPTISTRRPPTTYQENRTTTVYTFHASDPQRDSIAWSLEGVDAGDFTITTDASGRGVLTFSNPPDFENPADLDRDNIYELTVVARNGSGHADRLRFTITVTDVNEGPDITLLGTAITTVPENHPDTGVLARFAAADPENPGAGIYRWSTSGRDGGDFLISALGELRFRNSPDYERPADGDRDNVYEVTVRAYDGRVYGTLEAPLVITVTEVNEPPVITTTSRTEFTVRENSTAVVYTYRATDQDRNDLIRWLIEGADANDFAIYNGMLTFRRLPDLEQPVDANRDNVYEITVVAADNRGLRDTVPATITVTDQSEGPVIAGTTSFTVEENYDITQALGSYTATDAKDGRRVYPQWSLSGRDGGDFLIDRFTGVLSFRNTPDYDRPADSNRDNVYEVTIRGHDSRAYGYLNVVVTVTNINEGAPVVTGSAARTVRENTTSTIYTYRATDSDLDDNITWSAGGADGRHFVITEDRYGRGLLTFAVPPDFERPGDYDGDNIYDLEVVATDSAGLRGTLAVAVTVTALNEGPVVSGTAAFTVNENQKLSDNQAGSGTIYTAADPEAIGGITTTITWSTSGRDGGDFTIERETGVLTFRYPPNYERPADYNRDNVYDLTVRAHDGRNYGTFDVTVTVLAVNEGPEITGRDTFSFRENTPVTTRLYTYRATDPEGNGFTWELGGPDANDFNITPDSSGHGVLTFAVPPNFDLPSGSGAHGNEYLVTVQARDDQGYVGQLPVTVTVTDQNEGAVVTGRQTISVQENRDPSLVLATYSASDPEGQPITRWHVSGTDGGDFTISEDGELTFRNTPDYDRPADSNGDNEYRITVRAYDGRVYGSLDVTVTVSNVNEHDPVIRSGSRTSFTYREESASVLYTYYATDQDKDDVITWSAGGTDGHLFAFNDRNGLVFQAPPDYEIPGDSGRDNTYDLTVVATDSGRRSTRLDVTVTVTAVDEGPEIFGTTSYTLLEGQELVGATFTARDPEDPTIAVTNWRTSGTDGGDFTITQDGVLSFRNTPDYDRPADSNGDNVYLVTVQVSDGRYYGSLEVAVTVTDQNEAAPVVSGQGTLSFRENTASTLYTYRVTDADRGAIITWSVRGTDGGDFEINEGALTFSSAPDYELPADANSDNVYEITVVASDGSNEGVLAVTITVTEVNEGPDISGAQTLIFNENTPTDRVLANYTGVDPEDTSAEITRWSTSGRDGGDFTINSDGELTFRYPPNHERPADSNQDNVYELTVRASDGRVYGSYDVVVTVLPVDEAPEFRSGSRDSFTYRENGTSILYTYRATDPEGTGVTWSVGGADAGYFAISETGVLTFSEPPNFENPARFDGEFYDTEYDVTVQATDENGNTARLEVMVTVTDVNEGPEITGCTDTVSDTVLVIAFEDCDEITVSENHDEPLYTYTARDPEIPSLEITRWSVSGRDGGDFTIDADGQLSFRNPPDHERPADANHDSIYEVTVRASDGRYYGSFTVTVTVQAVDEAPELHSSSLDAFTYKENGTDALFTYRATDPEGDDVAWSLSGDDFEQFEISEEGALTFRDPPDYEEPADLNSDNIYEVTVEATDENDNTARLDIAVTVTNLTD